MRYFLPLLALPFLAVAQNFTSDPAFKSCAEKCVPTSALTQCGQNYQCYCTLQDVPLKIAGCMEKDCPDVLKKYSQEMTAVCESSTPSGVSTSAGPSMPPVTGNHTTPHTTKKPATTHAPKSGNSTTSGGEGITSAPSGSPTTSSSGGKNTSAPHTTSTGAAAVLEVAMQWPIVIAIGLVGAAVL